MQSIHLSKATRWFFIVFLFVFLLSVATVYYRYMVLEDYEIYLVFNEAGELINLYDENDEPIDLYGEDGKLIKLFDQYNEEIPYDVDEFGEVIYLE